MFSNSFPRDSPMATSDNLEQLREDATQTAREIIAGVEENFISRNDFTHFSK